MGLIFEWAPKKAAANRRKHRVSFDEAMTVFGDPHELMIPDPDHSAEERRSISIGESEAGRLLLAVYTQNGSVVRLIGAREPRDEEAAEYRERRGP